MTGKEQDTRTLTQELLVAFTFERSREEIEVKRAYLIAARLRDHIDANERTNERDTLPLVSRYRRR